MLDVSTRSPRTVANVRVTRCSWSEGTIVGEVSAGQFNWRFRWNFSGDTLTVEPSLGRALIKDPLGRFLEANDYQLESGGDYSFTIRAKF